MTRKLGPGGSVVKRFVPTFFPLESPGGGHRGALHMWGRLAALAGVPRAAGFLPVRRVRAAARCRRRVQG
jgi:hypothetical protein